MLPLKIPYTELWDEKNECMIFVKAVTLHLEHSLISISKWESHYHVPFLETQMTSEQSRYYVKCMTLNKDVDPNVYLAINDSHMEKVLAYINDSMTATTIKETADNKKQNRFITSELIYYYMIQYGIPWEFEKWHFNRLITLIRVCSEESKPQKKRSKSQIEKEYEEINRRNRAKFRTRG
jgi:hypothetical protein